MKFLLESTARLTLAILLLALSGTSYAQNLIFDGDFESGTFQGWIPSGENGGFASLAAKGTCYSANDTTAISFNGDPRSQYAALLRSNSTGDPSSVAILRSSNFIAGDGLVFSALSETDDDRIRINPVNLVVRILDSNGNILSELPLQTVVIGLAPGCPSEMRDTAFRIHYIDTRPFTGDISIEFSQNTNTPGSGFFTLIDNVINIPKGQTFVNQTQPIAVAGSSFTSSNILFLDPRESIDPDNSPLPLAFSWFINGEQTIRQFDLPCINLNGDDELAPGNHVATLYASDGINYSADTIRFVVPGTATTTGTITLSAPKGGPVVDTMSQVSADGITLTNPQSECNIDVPTIVDDPEDDPETDPGSDLLSIDIDSTDDSTFNTTFTVGNEEVMLTSNNVEIESSVDESITAIVISSDQSTDSITAASTGTLTVSGFATDSLSVAPASAGSVVTDATYETFLESVEFEYVVEAGDPTNTDLRTITYSVTDSAGNNVTTTSTVTVDE